MSDTRFSAGSENPKSAKGSAKGDKNTQAYFGPDGRLTDDRDATMTLDKWALMVPGDPTQAITVNRLNSSVASGVGTLASGASSHGEGVDATASGTASHAEGEFTTASGSPSHAEGGGTLASGNSSHAEGSETVASGSASHAEGSQTTASNMAAHAEGVGTTASGFVSHAEGSQTTASGQFAHAEGDGTLASGTTSHAEGFNTIASEDNSHAEGFGTIASGGTAHAEGMVTVASNIASHAEGVFAVASRWGQHAHSSGPGTTSAGNGGTQQSVITMAGETPGATAGESVELSFGSDALVFFSLEDGKGYTIMVTAIARGSISGAPNVLSTRRMYAVRRDAGVSTIAASGANEAIGDSAAVASPWTLTASIGVAPDRFALTFGTGDTTSAVRVTAKVEFVEIFNP